MLQRYWENGHNELLVKKCSVVVAVVVAFVVVAAVVAVVVAVVVELGKCLYKMLGKWP